MKHFELTFDGYWLDSKKEFLPNASGVYCVYSCTYNAEDNSVTLKKLLYVGESDDVNKRISTHNKYDFWKTKLNYNETLCYSFAEINSGIRVQAEAAIIYTHRPICNIEYRYKFPFCSTKLTIKGNACFLKPDFLVTPTY